MSLVCSVCTRSDQLQATAPPGMDVAYLWVCLMKTAYYYIAQEICNVVHCCCSRAQDSVQVTC